MTLLTHSTLLPSWPFVIIGAKKVYFASAAPPVVYSNVYGIDIPTRQELVAYQKTQSEIAAELGCDNIIYNTLEDVEGSVTEINEDVKQFESSCFNGMYPFFFFF